MIELCKLASSHALGPLTVKFPKAELLAIAFTDPLANESSEYVLLLWWHFHLSCHLSSLSPQAYFTSIFSLPPTATPWDPVLFFLSIIQISHRSSFTCPFSTFLLPGYLLGAKCPFNTAPHQTYLLPSYWKTHRIGGALREISSAGLNLVLRSTWAWHVEAVIRPEFQGNSMTVLSRVSRSGPETAFVLLSSVRVRVCEGPAVIFLWQHCFQMVSPLILSLRFNFRP